MLPEDRDLYYFDESGFDDYYSREYGYALRGEKVVGKVNGRQFARTGVVAAKGGSELVAPFAFSGSMDAFLKDGLNMSLVPALKNLLKSLLILDNAPFHRKNMICDIADEYGSHVFSAIFTRFESY